MAVNATLLRGTPVHAAGKFGNGMSGGCYYAAGEVAWLVGTNGANMTGVNGTIELWIKSPSSNPGSNKVAIGRDNAFWIGMGTSGQFIAIVGGGAGNKTVATSSGFADGQWHHVAIVLQDGAPSIYCDGNRYQQQTITTFGPAATQPGLVLGGFGTSNTTDWTSAIDEVSICTVAKYTGATYTVPVTEFAATRPYQTNLYHLEADGTDSDGSDLNPPTVGTISIGTSGGTDTITYPAPVAGSNAVSGVSLYEGVTPGGEDGIAVATNSGTGGGTFTRPTPSSGAKFYYVRPFDSSSVYGDPSNEVASPAAALIGPTDPGYVFDPYAWHINSTRALSNSGGKMRTQIENLYGLTFDLRFDVSNIPSTTTQRQQIAYRVDGQAWVEAVIAASITVSIPAATAAWSKHTIELVVKSTSEVPDRWFSPYLTSVKFLGIFGQPGTKLTAPDRKVLRLLELGDSITEGTKTLSGATADSTTLSDSRQSWATLVGDLLGAEVGVRGFGRQGVGIGGNGNVPVLGTTWKYVADGLPIDFTNEPDCVVVNIGTNDNRNSITTAAFKTAATELMNDILTTLPHARIAWFYPFGAYYAKADHQAAIAACSNPSRVFFVDTTGWWSTADSSDTLHPYGYANRTKIAPLAAAAIRGVINAGGDYVKVAGAFQRVSGQRL